MKFHSLLAAAGALLSMLPGACAQTTQRLDRNWEFYQGTLGNIWEIWRGKAASDNVTWKSVTLPHCFNDRDAVDPDTRYYQGQGYYRTSLSISNPFPNGRTLLHFEGAGQKSTVFVGLTQVAEHTGGYDEWTVDITDAAAALHKPDAKGKIPLAVRCDNSRDAETIPSNLSDFDLYGGLYRHVELIYVPAISLERLHLLPAINGNDGTIKVTARLRNPTNADDAVQIAIELRDPDGQIVQTTSQELPVWSGEKEIANLTVPQPARWSPDSPKLYRCSVTLKSVQGEENSEERLGFRTFEFAEHGPFKLNGERLLLKGTHYHQDHAGVGAAVPDDVVRRTFQMIKEMGANFVRLGHYQQSPLVLQLCDELGLLVWEEIPWCRGGIGGPTYRKQCRDMLTAMIDQHFNHPAVILWSLGNENAWPGDFEKFDQEGVLAMMKELNQLAHQLDPSRLTTIRHCDFANKVVDVYSPSIWAGWYSGRYTGYRKAVEGWMQKVPRFFHAEWGGDSHAGRYAEDPYQVLGQMDDTDDLAERGEAYKLSGGKKRAAKDGDWSESYICDLMDWHLKEQESIPNLTGSAQWIFKDFPTPLRPENPVPLVNQKGVVERDLTPKESYFVLQSYWSQKPMLHLFGHRWNVRWGAVDQERDVKVYSNCPNVELFVNGVSAGVKERNSQNFPAAGLCWKAKFQAGKNTLRAVALSQGTEITDEIEFEYETRKWGAPAKLTLQETSRKNGRITIEALLLDQDGVRCLDSTATVRFGLTGDGKLLDNLGTPEGSRVVQLSNGRAEISAEVSGNAVASVASKGLQTAFVSPSKN